MNNQKITVAEYLIIRMKQIGMSHLFGVPGNFVAPLLNTIEADQADDRLQLINCTNENIAGYAADGFASVHGTKGPAGLFLTAGVGSLSAVNAIAGSFMEKVPVLVINGVFTFNQHRRHELTGVLSSHMLHNPASEETIMREVCCDTQVVGSAETAPSQIDAALQKMLHYSQPVYLEIYEDILRMECRTPADIDWDSLSAPRQYSDKKTKLAIAETLKLIGDNTGPEHNLIYAGEGIKRLHLQDEFSHLLEATGLPYVTSLLSKSVISEDNPYFLGQFNGSMLVNESTDDKSLEVSNENADSTHEDSAWLYTPTRLKELDQQLKTTKTFIQLGVAKVSVHYPDLQPIGHNHILISQGAAMIGGKFIGNIDMRQYIVGLAEQFLRSDETRKPVHRDTELPAADEKLGYDIFGATLNHFINSNTNKFTVVSDAGSVLRTVSKLYIKEADGFYSQADWLAIGYSVPAALGVQTACGNSSRVIVATGDGAFQETATALSDHIRHGKKPIVLVLDNGMHGIEQFLVNPNPFRNEESRQEYEDSTLNTVNGYNRIPQWDYIKFAESFGAKALSVSTSGEFNQALEQAANDNSTAYLIHIIMPRDAKDPDISCNVSGKRQESINRTPGTEGRFIGEDEYPAPEWPKW